MARVKENLKRERLVNAIIASGKKAGKTYTKYDQMRLDAFHNERDISDYELNNVIEKINQMEKEDIEAGIEIEEI